MCCVYYTPRNTPVDVRNIPWRLVNTDSIKLALKMFNEQYPNDRALYITKV